MKPNRHVIAALFALGPLVFATPAYSGTATWTGTTNGTWSVPANWGGTTPSPGDDLVFNVATNTGSMTNDFAAGTAFHSLTLTLLGPSGLSGNPIDLDAGGITVVGFTQFNDFVPITLTASQTWSSSAPGIITLNGPATLDLGANTLQIIGGGEIFLDSTINGTGGITLGGVDTGLGEVLSVTMSGALNFTGTTTVNVFAGLVLTAIGTINTPIVVNVGGALSLVPGLHPLTSASVTLQPGSTLAMTINGASTGEFSSMGANANISLAGDLALTSNTVLPSDTVLTVLETQSGGLISGTFAGLPDGSTTSSGTQIYVVHYTATSVTLTAGATPVRLQSFEVD